MTALRNLSKPAFDAAIHAARCLQCIDADNATHRAVFREAAVALADQLEGNDVLAGTIILEAVRWNARDDIARMVEGLPVERAA